MPLGSWMGRMLGEGRSHAQLAACWAGWRHVWAGKDRVLLLHRCSALLHDTGLGARGCPCAGAGQGQPRGAQSQVKLPAVPSGVVLASLPPHIP